MRYGHFNSIFLKSRSSGSERNYKLILSAADRDVQEIIKASAAVNVASIPEPMYVHLNPLE